MSLAPEVQDRRSEQCQAQAEAEERAPVGQGGMPVPAKQRQTAFTHRATTHLWFGDPGSHGRVGPPESTC